MKLPDLKTIKNGILGLRRDVIRMMRLKFICVAMGILIVVFLIMLTAINIIMQKVSQSQSMVLLQQIAASERYDSLQSDDMGGFREEGFPPGGDKPPGSGVPPQKPAEHTDAAVNTTIHAAMLPDDDVVLMLLDEPAEDNSLQIPGWWGAAPDPNWWANMPNFGAAGDQQNSGGGNGQQGSGGDSGQQGSGGDSGQQNPWGGGNPWAGGNPWGDSNPWAGGNPWGDNNPWAGGNPWGDNNPWAGGNPWDPNWWNNQQQGNGDHSDHDDPKNTKPAMDQPAATAPPATEPPKAPTTEPAPAPPPADTPATQFSAQAAPHESVTQKVTEAPTETAVPAAVQPAETVPPTTAATPPSTVTAEVTTTAAESTTTTAEATTAQITAGTSPEPPEPREPRMDRWKVPITIDHFAIFVDKDGNFLDLRNTEDYTDEQAEEIMKGILAKQKTEGMYGWLQYCTAMKRYGTLIVVTDKTSDQGILNNLFRTTVIIGIFMLLVLLLILVVLSHWITVPVQQAFKRQKQFVSDAGHELKTPLAVLTTNADILQDEIGENKWLVYMQEQIGRMNQLVGDLLRLARMDNACQEYLFKDFDLSMAVAATALPFESTAFEKSKNLEMDIQPDVRYCGSEQHIRQLCAIFIDNAIKYSNENGIIKILLLQRGDHPVIEFYNTGCEISQAETEKIFERFYRGDRARSSSGQSGYGLGLAIAKSIMDVHKIKFQVTCEQGRWIRFLLTF